MAFTVDEIALPQSAAALASALENQREYTLALYADLPESWWQPAQFPYRRIVNPPLWELAHIAWFQEFFAMRWQPDDVDGLRTPSCWSPADRMFDSRHVPHADRWTLEYPSREECLAYLRDVLAACSEACRSANALEGFYLVLLHEDMHAEAFAMTLATLALPFPECVPARRSMHQARQLTFDGGVIVLGESGRAFRFDNERPAHRTVVDSFTCDARPVSEAEFATFRRSAEYHNPACWSAEGNAWRAGVSFLL